MARLLKENGIGCPETFAAETGSPGTASPWKESPGKDGDLERFLSALSWPVVVKPRFGMGSLGVLKAYTREELWAACSMCAREISGTYLRYESASAPDRAVLVQECCPGAEYGLDVISSLDGEYVTTIVRRKFGMRSGETDEAVILGPEAPEYSVLRETGEQLARLLHPKGLIDVDVILETGAPEKAGKEALRPRPRVIDINARFGGGYPFSHLAGADVPRAYVLWMEGRNEEAAEVCRGARPGVRGFKDIVPRVVTGCTEAV
jgi:carbamoyl-phosphate synthase large subunit